MEKVHPDGVERLLNDANWVVYLANTLLEEVTLETCREGLRVNLRRLIETSERLLKFLDEMEK